MPWNNQGGNGGGGGPWGPPPGGGSGGGGQNPWGRPPGGGGGGAQGPDLEELLRKGQDRLRQMMPGGLGGGIGLTVIVGGLVALWLASGVYRVQPDERGVVMRFGAYERTSEPGLRYHLPAPLESVVVTQTTTEKRLDIGYRSQGDGRRGSAASDVPDESLMLTGDENIVDIDFTVAWNVKDAPNFIFNIREPELTVRKAAESAMREVIGRTEIQPALTEARSEIEQSTRKLMQVMLDEYQSGIEIVRVQLQKVDPPAPVVDAFNEVQRARQERERLRNDAESYRNGIIPVARGEAEKLIQEASAYREQVVSLAQGDAKRFLSVLEAYSLAPEVTARRMYLETMQSVLSNTNKVIIDGKASGQGVVPYMPLNEMLPRLGAPATAQPAAPRP
jgi:modulator of FtsH protease HflK